MRTLYVVYKKSDGAIGSETIEIEGKVNHLTVEKALKKTFSYYDRFGSITILSWQDEEPFTFEEKDKFYNTKEEY